MSNLLRKKLLLLAAICLVATSSAMAAEEVGAFSPKNFTATLGMTSDYVFRGISQTTENFAVQGSFDYAHPAGFYLGVWSSNVSFGGNVEVDYYGGYRNAYEGLNYDLGVLYYSYPSAHDDPEFNFYEIAAKLSYTFKLSPVEPTIGLSYNYSPDFFGEDGSASYVNGKLSLGLPAGFGVSGEVGYQTVAGDKVTGHHAGKDGKNGFDYIHYRVGVSKADIVGFNADISYHDTTEHKFLNAGDNIADGRVVFTLSRTF